MDLVFKRVEKKVKHTTWKVIGKKTGDMEKENSTTKTNQKLSTH
jgi:hypothetical protein